MAMTTRSMLIRVYDVEKFVNVHLWIIFVISADICYVTESLIVPDFGRRCRSVLIWTGREGFESR